jgi:hypothetical protein
MSRVALLFAVALLSFATGVLTHRVTLTCSSWCLDQEQMFSVAELREDDWHRFYEAAMLSGDENIRREMDRRSRCMGSDLLLDAWLVGEVGANAYCVKRGGNLNVSLGRLPGKFHYDLLHQHRKWTLRNIVFLKEINTPQKARAYLSRKDWESY